MDEARARYIAETASSISERLTQDQGYYSGRGVRALSEDVAWLARQVALLADEASAVEATRGAAAS